MSAPAPPLHPQDNDEHDHHGDHGDRLDGKDQEANARDDICLRQSRWIELLTNPCKKDTIADPSRNEL